MVAYQIILICFVGEQHRVFQNASRDACLVPYLIEPKINQRRGKCGPLTNKTLLRAMD